MMLKRYDRQRDILNLLEPNQTRAIADIAKALSVSEETIRRELRVMEEAGTIVRLHGAVRLPPQEIEGPFDLRMQTNIAAKTRIAEAVVKFISDGDTLFLDSGSTSCFVAKALSEHRQLKIITNSLAVAQAIRKDKGHTLFLAGGELNAAYQSFSDRHAQEFVSGFRPSLSILTVGAVHPEHGLMDHSPSEAIMSRIAYATASRVLLAVDQGKFGRIGLVHTASTKDVDILVTDAPLAPAFREAFSHAEVVVA
jgi:DeoR family glycerol-3-phosphate regulon repressor